MEEYFKLTIEESKLSLLTDDVPVGAIIVSNNKIIAKGHNTREQDQSILGHAEINAIISASKYLNNWNLSDCDMYVSLKPCSMCESIIKESRIKNVYYLLDKLDYKKEYDKLNINNVNNLPLLEKYYHSILSSFFKSKR